MDKFYKNKKSIVSIYDRKKCKIISTCSFDDYIKNCYYARNLLFVELMKKEGMEEFSYTEIGELIPTAKNLVTVIS